MASTVASTLTGEILLAYGRLYPWTTPVLSVPGSSDEPTLTFLDDIVKKIMSKSNPWPWNEALAPTFFTQPYQQDYPTSISQNVMGWLQNCTMIDINNVTTSSKNQPPLQCVARLLPQWIPGYPTKICWIINSSAQLGVWPGPGVVYQNPLAASQGGPTLGGPGNNPLAAIKDTNGNIQVVTAYGTTGQAATGASAPAWPSAGAAAGTNTTDGTQGLVWTVQDPNGIAFRLDQVASFGSQVFQIAPVYQLKPPNITSLGQTIAPIPDDLSYLVKRGFLAYCYEQVDHAKFTIAYAEWQAAIKDALGASDREDQEFGFYPADAMQSGCEGGYDYTGWPGWSPSN